MPDRPQVKIMHILNSFSVGGLENGVVNLINGMKEERYFHVICCIRSLGPMIDRIERKDVRLYCMNSKPADRFMALKLRKLIKEIKPDIVHTRNWGTIDGIIAGKMAGIKSIIHGEHGREAINIGVDEWKKNLFRKIILTRISCVIAVSENLRQWLVKRIGVTESKVVKIINGVDTNKFKPAANRERAKGKIGLDPQIKLIGTVGRLDPVKNYSMFIQALKRAGMVKEQLKTIFIGDGPERQSLERMVHEIGLNNVLFLGEQRNVIPYLQAMDVFVLPSLTEGISNTILEAMACGVPVIATKVGGNPEIVEPEKTGVLIESRDTNALAEQLRDFCNNGTKWEKFGIAARNAAEDKFSLARMIEEYEGVYDRMALKRK